MNLFNVLKFVSGVAGVVFFLRESNAALAVGWALVAGIALYCYIEPRANDAEDRPPFPPSGSALWNRSFKDEFIDFIGVNNLVFIVVLALTLYHLFASLP